MLEIALPPADLLAAAGEPPSLATAARLAKLILQNKSTNKSYRREVVQVWAYHFKEGGACEGHGERLSNSNLRWFAQRLTSVAKPPIDDLSVGPVLAELAAREIETWPVATARVASRASEDRLRRILQECAAAATLDKHGDLILHGLLKLRLTAAAVASLASEPPYEQLNLLHDMGVNDIVNRWLDTPMESLADMIEYDSDNPEGLTLAGGLIAEVFDHSESDVSVNSEILSKQKARLFAFTGLGNHTTPDVIGVAHNKTLIVAPQSRPIASVVLAWARLTPESLLARALLNPLTLPPGSLPRKWLT